MHRMESCMWLVPRHLWEMDGNTSQQWLREYHVLGHAVALLSPRSPGSPMLEVKTLRLRHTFSRGHRAGRGQRQGLNPG